MTETIRAFCADSSAALDLDERCVREAVGAIVAHDVRVTDLPDWGSYTRRSHFVTLIVACAVNVDTWRHFVPSGPRWRHIYITVPNAVDEWAVTRADCGA